MFSEGGARKNAKATEMWQPQQDHAKSTTILVNANS